jgi:four helix bundle protein
MTREELQTRTAAFARCATLFARPRLAPLATRPAISQLVRAAGSVAANYRAAGLGRSRAEFIAKLGVVREEADEAVYWLEHLRDTGLDKDTELQSLLIEAKELSRIFTASLQTARRNHREARLTRSPDSKI